ncbi:MAG: ferredoxin reductase [Actinobacteria bacterium]|nr:ferredoxin reductase [Actinomycetota bacterium]
MSQAQLERSEDRFVPERAQEAGGSVHAGPLQARTRRLPRPLRRVLRSRVVELATTPHGVEPYLRMVNPLWSIETTRALLVDKRRETRDVTTLVLDPGPDWGPHEAGQHVRIDVELDGRRRTRYFSVSSSAHRHDGLITLTIKANPDGFVSRFTHTHARTGLVIDISEPRGEFVLPTPRPERLLLVSGGSGITPCMSMLRTLLDEGHAGEVSFLHYAKTSQDRIFGAELDDIAARHDHVLVETIYSDEDPDGARFTGFLDREHLDTLVPDWTGMPAYVCGPPPMLDTAEELWGSAEAMDNFHIERFTLRVPSADADADGMVRLCGSDIEVENDGRPLLVQAEDAGLEPEYGCRMGICKTCTTRKIAGTTQNLSSGDVSQEDDEDIQICVSVALGDVELDL